jgi:hypothetical protein
MRPCFVTPIQASAIGLSETLPNRTLCNTLYSHTNLVWSLIFVPTGNLSDQNRSIMGAYSTELFDYKVYDCQFSGPQKIPNGHYAVTGSLNEKTPSTVLLQYLSHKYNPIRDIISGEYNPQSKCWAIY